MHKSELKANPTVKNCVIMVYELRVGTIGTYRSIGSLKIQFWSLFNIPLKRINCTLVSYVNNNERKLLGISRFLNFLSLDLVGWMKTILGFSKSIAIEICGYKNLIRIKI